MRALVAAADAGVVESNVDAAKPGGGLGDALLDLVGLADVHVQRQDILDLGAALLEGRDGFREGIGVDVGEGQAGDAVLGEGEGRGLSDACA